MDDGEIPGVMTRVNAFENASRETRFGLRAYAIPPGRLLVRSARSFRE
jgi:hypothetical protein